LLSALWLLARPALEQYHELDFFHRRSLTNAQDTTYFEQVTLPFGTALTSESTGSTNRRFTSYDRSSATGLDYAVNRNYDSQQGRFTQVDPIGMQASSLIDPQSLNMYAYCGNDPVNRMDANGLFWGKLWRAIKKIVTSKWFQIALAVAIIVIAHYYPNSFFGFGGGTAASHSAAAPVLHTAAEAAARQAALASGLLTAAPLEGAIAGSGIASAVSLGLAGALAAGVASGSGNSSSNSKQENAHSKVRCPPTGGQLANNSIVKAGLNQALKEGIKRRLEHGGWVFWNKATSALFTIIKQPTVDPLNVSGVADRWDAVFLGSPPSPPAGWSIIATFHTHLENVGAHSFDIALENARRIPGLIIMPNGKIDVYGNFSRGIWNTNLPGCK
jgi:RHS repeat-associated protein